MYLPEINMDQNTNSPFTGVKPANPLSQWYRQPKIYIRLPSGGKFYPQGALDISANGEYPVYAMTAKDELMFKTPDALLSGQSTVEVIKSCIPAIIDPWQMPTIDLDVCLIAIRLATYGEKMELAVTCPKCNTTQDYLMNLREWLDTFTHFNYMDKVLVDPLVVTIRPYTYQEITKTSLQTFEQQRIIGIVNNENISEEEKINQFNKSFLKLTELTVDLITGCIASIETPNGATSDKGQIKEFIANTSKEVFDTISKHITAMKDQIELKPQDIICSHCQHEFTTPVTMDQSNFFAVRS